MGILDSIKSVFSSSSEVAKTSEVTPLSATKAFDITISGVKAGSTYAEVKAQAEGAEAVSQNVDITVTEKPVTYTKYTFQIEQVAHVSYSMFIDSTALQNQGAGALLGGEYTGGSSETVDLVSSSTAPRWDFDKDKLFDYVYENIKDLTTPEAFYFQTELGEVSDIGDNVDTFLWIWLAAQSQYGIGIRCDKDITLGFSGTILSKETVEISPSQAIDTMSMNKIVVDAETYPDFANFVGCWTFDANANAIEGVIYKEVVSS